MSVNLQKAIVTLDRVKTAIMPGDMRHHGIVINAKTREPVDRPESIGSIRHVRVDLRGHRRADAAMQGAEVMLALRILYDDITPAIQQAIAKRAGAKTLPAAASLGPGMTIASFIRPIAARIEEGAVSIWAEVDKQTAWAHESMGRQSFGAPLFQEPQIRRDAVIIKGPALEVLSGEAIGEIADRHARQQADLRQQKRTRRRKITLAVAVTVLMASIALSGILTGLATLVSMLVCLLVMELSLSESGEHLAVAWRNALRDMGSKRSGPTTSKPADDAGMKVLEAITRHAPEHMAAADEAVARMKRLRLMVDESIDPSAHSEIASIEGDLRATMQAYERPARIAVGSECRSLATDLAATVVQIGNRAEIMRQGLLRDARDGFDTQRRYLENKSEHLLLAPVA